jgi:heparan-alpha-glucosaminide N-acetyltransferase
MGNSPILILAGSYALIECKGRRRWDYLLEVVGMNSIAVYVMSWMMSSFFGDALDRHFGRAISLMAGLTIQPALHGFAVLLIFWLILFWMYRREIS